MVDTRYTLSHKSGFSVTLSSFGTIIVSIKAPNAQGKLDDVLLGFDTRAEYESPANPFCGAIIGRVANRIGTGSYQLGDKRIELIKNEAGERCLHGGDKGFSHVNW